VEAASAHGFKTTKRGEMQILHAADLHIDSPLGGLSAYEGAPVDEIRGATRRAVENLVRVAIEREVDLVVLAGDIFDGDWRDYSTGLFWNEQLGQLNDAEIPVVSVAGNHDAASEISRNLRLPPNVTQLATSQPETVVFDDLEIAVVGQGYATRAVTTDLAVGYPVKDSKLFTIGLLHTSLDGRPGHSNYAPCSVEALRGKGYDYWGLGHIHTREVVHTDPWIVYPGNLQGRKCTEVGPKGATLITVESGEVQAVEHLDLDDVRWHWCEIDATTLSDVDDIRANIVHRFDSIADEADQRLAAIRLVVTGPSAAHEALWKDHHGFEADVRSTASQAGRMWVEKVKIETTRPVGLMKTREDDAVGSLARRISDLQKDPVALAAYESLFTSLRNKIGADARTADDDPTDTRQIGTAEHLAENLTASLEMVVALLAEEQA
jgi:exonuclease SbcD